MKTDKKEKAKKPKYNMWQCVWYMIQRAWKENEKKVLVICLLTVAFNLLRSLINLYITPVILGKVEQKTPMKDLVGTIVIFVAAMMLCEAVSGYVKANRQRSRSGFRMGILADLNDKTAMTSYPNLSDKRFEELRTKAWDEVRSNFGAAEYIWNTLTELVENSIGFLIYILLMTRINPFILLCIILASVIGYFANKWAYSQEYKNEEERCECIDQWDYIHSVVRDSIAAKDIRIFGMRPWIEEVKKKAEDTYNVLRNQSLNYLLITRIVDLVLALLRNGIAYAYLIHMVLSGHLTAAEFLLYFSAVSGFAVWINGILTSLGTLYRQCLGISSIRECLEYPEPFAFENGKELKWRKDKTYEIRLEKVSYRYPEAEKDILSEIDLTLHPGEKLAIACSLRYFRIFPL